MVTHSILSRNPEKLSYNLMIQQQGKKILMMDYNVIVSKKADRYILYINELQLIATGDNLEAAYQELNRKKEERLKDFEEAGLGISLPPPNSHLPNEENAARNKDIGIFILKTLVAGFVFILVITFASNKINNIFAAAPQKIKLVLKDLPRQIANEMEFQLHNAAEMELTLERKRKIKKSLHMVNNNIRPFIEGLKLNPIVSDSKETVGDN
jgi:hypothetical protein